MFLDTINISPTHHRRQTNLKAIEALCWTASPASASTLPESLLMKRTPSTPSLDAHQGLKSSIMFTYTPQHIKNFVDPNSTKSYKPQAPRPPPPTVARSGCQAAYTEQQAARAPPQVINTAQNVILHEVRNPQTPVQRKPTSYVYKQRTFRVGSEHLAPDLTTVTVTNRRHPHQRRLSTQLNSVGRV